MLLEELQEARNLSANLAEDIDRHRKTVNRRLLQLEDYDLVRDVGRGLYEITERGRIALAHIHEYDADSDHLETLIERELESDDAS